MNPKLTYTIDPTIPHPTLQFLDIPITEKSWVNLGINLAKEPKLAPNSVSLLQNLWKQGLAIIVVVEEEIILFIGKQVVYDEEIKKQMAAFLEADIHHFPDLIIYKGLNAWVHKNWRGRKIYMKARKLLMPPSSDLNLSSTGGGVGITPIWNKMNWSMLSWTETSYLSAFEGWYTSVHSNNTPVKLYTLGKGWNVFTTFLPWNGSQVWPNENKEHEWGKYNYFGVSDCKIAMEVERAFAKAAQNDLSNWHECLKHIFDQ
ncbi:MAG: hypothetical protein AB8B69_01490, partial [Chitinophagales bacterium]